MPRPKNVLPTYRRHPRDGSARCWVGGKWITLGKFGSPESQAEFQRICAELRAGTTPPTISRHAITVLEVIDAFRRHAEAHYRRRDGSPTNEVKEYAGACRFLCELYGHTPAAEFGPVALQAVRKRMIESGWCRTRINKQVGRVRRIFRWAAGQELVPATVVGALACVQGLQRGRTDARETERVKPVDDRVVDATLPFLVPTVRDMVELQRASGLRPGEVRLLTAADVETAGEVWVYRPDVHKMAHLGREKAVPLGPRARAILEPRMSVAGYLFSPRQAREEMYAARRARRKSKVPPSQLSRRRDPATHRKRWTEKFTDYGYAAMVRRACRKAGVSPWHPNQLRHTFATKIRKEYGLEAAQVLLGHARADVTQVYAERDWRLAVDVVRAAG